MEFEVRLEGITAEIVNNLRKRGFKVRMFLEEFVGLAEELFRSDDGVHYSFS
jgi:hypothetical protein